MTLIERQSEVDLDNRLKIDGKVQILKLVSFVLCPVSSVPCLLSRFLCLMSSVLCPLYFVFCPQSLVIGLLPFVFCNLSLFLGHLFFFLLSFVLFSLSLIRCLFSNVHFCCLLSFSVSFFKDTTRHKKINNINYVYINMMTLIIYNLWFCLSHHFVLCCDQSVTQQ